MNETKDDFQKPVKLLGMRNTVLSLLDGEGFHLMPGYDQLESVLTTFASSVTPGQINAGEFLKVVAFAVVTFENHILAVEKENETILGFGTHCLMLTESKNITYKNIVIENIYNELDLYIPNTTYRFGFEGILYSPEREQYDKTSIGCIFRAQLQDRINNKVVKGKEIALKNSDINKGMLKGWSRVIHNHYVTNEKL